MNTTKCPNCRGKGNIKVKQLERSPIYKTEYTFLVFGKLMIPIWASKIKTGEFRDIYVTNVYKCDNCNGTGKA